MYLIRPSKWQKLSSKDRKLLQIICDTVHPELTEKGYPSVAARISLNRTNIYYAKSSIPEIIMWSCVPRNRDIISLNRTNIYFTRSSIPEIIIWSCIPSICLYKMGEVSDRSIFWQCMEIKKKSDQDKSWQNKKNQ